MHRALVGVTAAIVALSAGPGDALAADRVDAPPTSVDVTAPTPTDTRPGTDAPEPVVTEPAPVATTPEPNPITPDDDDVLQGFLVLVGLLLLAVATIAVIAAIARSRRRAPGSTPPRVTSSPQSGLLSTAQWINDQLSMELMAAAPEAAMQRWSIERSRLDNVAVGAQQQFLQSGAAEWQLLGQSVSALATALDTNIRLRAQAPANVDLIGESVTVVNRQRAELRQLIDAMRPTIDR